VNGIAESDELFVWIGNTMVEQRNGQGAVVKRYFDQGFVAGAVVYYYGKDHLGSIKNLTDSTGTIQAQLDYGLYGEVAQANGQVQPDFGYAGLFYHQRSGLHFAEYRVLDTQLKRWLNRDPAYEDGSINLYGYVSNDPATGVDPTGLQTYQLPDDGSWIGPFKNGDVVKSPSGNDWTFHSSPPPGHFTNQKGAIEKGTEIHYIPGVGDAATYPAYGKFDDPPGGRVSLGGTAKIIPKTPSTGGGGNISPPSGGGNGGNGGNDDNGGNAGGGNNSGPGPGTGQNGNGNGQNSVHNYPPRPTCIQWRTNPNKPWSPGIIQ
jgi:RHS repeat-associated protein